MQNETEDRIARLIDLLRLEKDVIRNAEFAALPDLVSRKEVLMEELKGTPARLLLAAQEMAIENQRLLDAAIKGVRSVQARLAEIREASKSYTSYDQHGKARKISPEGGSVERRA
ncbi:hypothetical protein H9N28_17280 [Rhodobacter capsulatus]|uniref:hypothetical protein n=1 Tax=Rhodobacter capsulatus TaxID=1061 RepID=UPI0006DC7C2C|nr:hypothetical protein [Rhodobacter capsulatus]KQB14582.1 hypothetical protein AP073_02765 [Rhodobacter capsulatus]KQB14881.1 hypothetical protein AP071_03015 [Rhodobacter capsulatus]PZX25032.1 hypothetical protein LY44_01805 [Rhodobacter capsulatus]QNR63259.1 hypothetical protein H9N28_17280 [Rhodobacter capsulatus]